MERDRGHAIDAEDRTTPTGVVFGTPSAISATKLAISHLFVDKRRSNANRRTSVVENADDPEEYPMYNVQSPSCRPMSVEINIDEKPVHMEVNTGATLSILSHNTYLETWPEETAPPIESSDATLSTYNNESPLWALSMSMPSTTVRLPVQSWSSSMEMVRRFWDETDFVTSD